MLVLPYKPVCPSQLECSVIQSYSKIEMHMLLGATDQQLSVALAETSVSESGLCTRIPGVISSCFNFKKVSFWESGKIPKSKLSWFIRVLVKNVVVRQC